ncbi:MAG: PQQ-binding-like beta-propeller repeat protein [Gemmataceae bacterium]
MKRILALLTLFACGALGLAGDWPSWRGPTQDGTSEEAKLPTAWSDTENVRWKAKLPGAGNSSPVVWKGRVFVTASSGREHSKLIVACYDRDSGKREWESSFFASPAPAPFGMFPPERGHAAPSPATDGEVLVALFGSGDLLGLGLDGRLLWFRSLAAEYGDFRNEYGVSASPVIDGGTVFVQIDHDAESYLLAVDVATGKTRWRTKRDARRGWATPLVTRVGNTRQVVCLGTGKITGYDAATGKEAWSLSGLERLCSVTPLERDGKLYATSGPRGEVLCIDLSHSASGKMPEVLWRSKRIGPFIPSPMLVGDLLVVPDDQGFLTGLDAKTGEERWRKRAGGRARPSPVLGGGYLYLTGLDGTTAVYRAVKEFEAVVKNRLGEEVAASPALAHGCVFLRGEKHLWCLGK